MLAEQRPRRDPLIYPALNGVPEFRISRLKPTFDRAAVVVGVDVVVKLFEGRTGTRNSARRDIREYFRLRSGESLFHIGPQRDVHPELGIPIQRPILRWRPLFTSVRDLMMFIEKQSILQEPVEVRVLERGFKDSPHEQFGRDRSPLCDRPEAGGG